MQTNYFIGKILHVLVISVFIFIVGCAEKEIKPISVTSVTLNSTSMELTEGESQSLTAVISPSNAENQKVLWMSSNSSIATVNDGVVTAVKQGKAIITAKSDDGGKTATCEVTVNAKVYHVESVTLSHASAELTEGDELTLTATVNPSNASNKSVIWTSSDESVARVINGKVLALKSGTATITVKTVDGGKTAICDVAVNAKVYPVESVSLDKTSVVLNEGDELTLTATVNPSNASNKSVTWTSSNESVAKVIDGKVTALKDGLATITVKTVDGNKTSSCEVVVGIPVSKVTLNYTSLTLPVEFEHTLTAKISPLDASFQTVNWSTDSPNVVNVDQTGNITTISYGKANITAEAGGVIAVCIVEVVAQAVAVKDYVDEYGVNHGKGIGIGRIVWAPVNCGYHETDYKDGKLYQWGRKYGQGHSYDKLEPDFVEGPISVNNGHKEEYANTFFMLTEGNDWAMPKNDSLWNSGTEENPIKTGYDPCPDGWRVPTSSELYELAKNHESKGIIDYFSGIYTYVEGVPSVKLPNNPYRWSSGEQYNMGRYDCFYWSSSVKGTSSYSLSCGVSVYTDKGTTRVTGGSVRCVQE